MSNITPRNLGETPDDADKWHLPPFIPTIVTTVAIIREIRNPKNGDAELINKILLFIFTI